MVNLVNCWLLISLFSLIKTIHTTGSDNANRNAGMQAGTSQSKPRKVPRDLVVLTDMQPDDRIALAMIGGNRELSRRLLFVGTTLLNTERKKALAKRQLRQMGMDYVEVHAGTGAHPSNYQLNVETAKAAFEYLDEEGRGILPDDEWEKYREVTDQNQSVDENDFYQRIHMNTLMADPESISRSFLIVHLPESTKPNMVDRYKEDRETVIRILDMMNIGFPLKSVYRLPKPRGILDPSPRPLRVVFPVHLAISVIFGCWTDFVIEIRKEFGPKVGFQFAITQDSFEIAKDNLIKEIESEEFLDAPVQNEVDKMDEENKREESKAMDDDKKIQGKYNKEEEEMFYDAYDHEEEARLRKKEKKKLKKKQKKMAKKIELNQKSEETTNAVINEENAESDNKIVEAEIPAENEENRGAWTKVERNKAKTKVIEQIQINEQTVKGITLKEFTNFFVYNEEVNTIIIKGLLDVDHHQNKASERHEADFKAACELLYALGIELLPLAVHRTAPYETGLQRPPLKVFLRNPELAKLAVDVWKVHSYALIRAYKNKPEWEYVFIHENRIIKAENPNLDRNIVNKLVNSLNEVDDNVPSSTKHTYFMANKKKQQQENVVVNPLQKELKSALLKATEENPLEILLMTAPTDLVQVLVRNPELSNRIGRVHLMGGWTEFKPTRDENRQVITKGIPTIWSNYNLAMAPESAKRIFQMDIPIRLHTYRDVRETFNGSVNEEKFGDVIKLIEQSESQVMKDFLKAAQSWDQHVLRTMPYLHAAIDKYAGKQFSPADPILVVGLTSPEFAQTARKRKIKLQFAQEELSMGDVLEVQIEYDVPESKIELVTSISRDAFREIFQYELQTAIRRFSPRVKIPQLRALPRYEIVQKESGGISVKRDFPCHRCKEYGHVVKDCPIRKNIVCYECGVSGHIARNCPNAKRP